MDLSHLSWPFFDTCCFEFAGGFDRWVRAKLGGFEQDEGGERQGGAANVRTTRGLGVVAKQPPYANARSAARKFDA